jgi:hypothetical protein
MPPMIKVFLFSTFRDPEKDTHWASPYLALRKAFAENQSDDWQLVDTPAAADLVLICPRAQNPVFPMEVFRGGIAWRHRHKCVVISCDDNPTMTHKGFYTSLQSGATRSPWLKGGFYPFVTYAQPSEPFPLDIDFSYLFSFQGSFATHPVRQRIGALVGAAPRDAMKAFLIKDTSKDNLPARREQEDPESFRRDYLAGLYASKFILCPRGMCPSSIRLFETMKARRAPVVISDEWIRPPELPWDRFAITVKEKDIPFIPAILEREEQSFFERAQAARQSWEEFFAPQTMANTVTRWGMSVVTAAAQAPLSPAHLTDLLKQTVRWRFFRRGVVTELHRLITNSAS